MEVTDTCVCKHAYLCNVHPAFALLWTMRYPGTFNDSKWMRDGIQLWKKKKAAFHVLGFWRKRNTICWRVANVRNELSLKLQIKKTLKFHFLKFWTNWLSLWSCINESQQSMAPRQWRGSNQAFKPTAHSKTGPRKGLLSIISFLLEEALIPISKHVSEARSNGREFASSLCIHKWYFILLTKPMLITCVQNNEIWAGLLLLYTDAVCFESL